MPDDPRARDLRLPPAGLRLARATWEDLGRVTALYQRVERDRAGRASTRSEDVRFRWLGHGGPGEDTLLVLDGGELVAYAEFHEDTDPWTEQLDLYTEGRVDPAHAGRGIATFLLRRAEDRAIRAAARAGQRSAILRTAVVDGDAAALAWHHRRGFRPVRHFLQMRLDLGSPPPVPVWPPGVTVRAVARDELAAVWDVHQRAFADLATSVPAAFPSWREQRVERDPAFDLSLWFLAVVEDEPVGVCLARATTPEAAEIGDVRDLGVVPSWRRRGVAMALLRTALQAFWQRGLTGAALEVDDVTLEGAVALYRAAGMQVVRRTDVMELVLPSPPPAGDESARGRPGPA